MKMIRFDFLKLVSANVFLREISCMTLTWRKSAAFLAKHENTLDFHIEKLGLSSRRMQSRFADDHANKNYVDGDFSRIKSVWREVMGNDKYRVTLVT